MLDFMHLIVLAEAAEPTNWKDCPHSSRSYNASSHTAVAIHSAAVAIALNAVAANAAAH